jgi:hypothetical protein
MGKGNKLTVISVHNGMDESIQDDGQVDITIVVDMGVKPVKEKNGGMMVDVQKRKLTPLFTKDDKDGVHEIPNLGKVKHIQEIR